MEPVDRLPVWPKVWREYPGFQTGPWRSMSLPELHEWFGSDLIDMAHGDSCIRDVSDSCRTALDRTPRRRVRRIITPLGELIGVTELDEGTNSWHPTKYPVESRGDIRILSAYLRDVSVEVDHDRLAAYTHRVEEIGESGITCVGCGTSALMTWVEHWAGPEMAHYLLADHEADVRELFEAHHELMRKRVSAIAETSPADFLFFNENTSTTLISPRQYATYCAPHMQEYARIIRSHGRKAFLHMCGHLRDLLPQLAKLDYDAFEAFTSPPLGNCTLADGRGRLPTITLIGGTNAIDWASGAEAVIHALERDLAELPSHRGVVVTSGGAMPPQVEPESIRHVVDWVKTQRPRW